MSICDSGIGIKSVSENILIPVPVTHPLLVLSNHLPWERIYSLVAPDLMATTRSKRSHYGRKLKSRIHLGAYLLQKMYNFTDRQTEDAIRYNAAYQVFCGYGVVDQWHCPDHTRIEAFRSRLRPETQQQLANVMSQQAVAHGFATPFDIDIDSTIQEANITYPTDAKMLRKLGGFAATIVNSLRKVIPDSLVERDIIVDMKTIASKARACFFLTKMATKADKSTVLSALLTAVTAPVKATINVLHQLSTEQHAKLSGAIRRTISQLLDHGEAYLLSVQHFIATGTAETTKRLCFHVNEVACFSKKKEHKKYEFGRAFHLVRLTGNFLWVAKSTSVRMDDKSSLIPVVDEFEMAFEPGKLHSVATDKGYYGANNIKQLRARKVVHIGVQVPANITHNPTELSANAAEQLHHRRAGIEPLIGHTKHGGQLGRSRMKNDKNTESAGYGAVLGFNLRQTIRALFPKKQAPDAHF